MREQRAPFRQDEGQQPAASFGPRGEHNSSGERHEPLHVTIAEGFVANHAGNVADTERDSLVASVTREVAYISSQNMTNEQRVAAFEDLIVRLRVESSAINHTQPAPNSRERNTRRGNEAPLPTDADDPENQYDNLDRESRNEKKRGWIKRALIGGNLALGGLVLRGYSLVSERQNKQAQKYQQQPGESNEAYEKRKHKASIVGWVGAAAIGGLMYHTKIFGLLDSDGGGQPSASPAESEVPTGGDGADDESASPDAPSEDEIELASYSNSDASFYDFENKQFAGDHGTPLVASEADGERGAGFADWMNRNKTETNGLGNVAAGLGIDQDGNIITDPDQLAAHQSLENRNVLADQIDGDRSLQRSYDENIRDALENKFSLETITIDRPYTTTLMNDMNGDPVISIKKHVDLGGTAFKATNPETGEVTYWRKECGGYQQIWFEDIPEPTPVYQSSYAPVVEYHSEPVTPVVVHENPGIGGPTPELPVPELPEPEVPVPELPTPEEPIPEEPEPEEPEPEQPTPIPEGKRWGDQVDTGMDPLGVTAPTEDFATAGNGTGSPSLTGTEPIGSGNTDVVVEGATVGTGGGRDESTGDTGADAAEADRDQSHDSATDEATEGTDDATGTADEPVAGRVE